MSAPATASGIDPRGPRFGAAITAVLLLVTIALALGGAAIPSILLLAAINLLFAWGAFAGIRRHPYGRIYAAAIRPRLSPPSELENAAAPTFAQGVGFLITGLGLVVALAGVPFAVTIASALAFTAAFLNSVFAYCLGCQIYVLFVRAGLIRRGSSTAV